MLQKAAPRKQVSCAQIFQPLPAIAPNRALRRTRPQAFLDKKTREQQGDCVSISKQWLRTTTAEMMADRVVDNVARKRRWAHPESPACVVLQFPASTGCEPAAPVIDKTDRLRLERIRALARKSSIACRPECLIGCVYGRRLSDAPSYCAAEQFRGFVEAVNRTLIVYRPGAGAVSQDEHWLLRLTQAIELNDVGAASALIAFRVSREDRRQALAMATTVTHVITTNAIATNSTATSSTATNSTAANSTATS